MNYDIKCSKCTLLADTHTCSRLWQSFIAMSLAFSSNTDQIN